MPLHPRHTYVHLAADGTASDGRVFFRPNAITQTFIPGLRSWSNRPLSAIGHRAFGEFKREPVQKGLITLYGE